MKNDRHPSRSDWQKFIEQQIVSFNADANEGMELLDALTGTLKDRYDAGQLADVQHEAGQLREALEELDATTTSFANISEQDLREAFADMEQGNEIEEGDWSNG